MSRISNKLWLLYSYDESSNSYAALGLFLSLQDLIDCIHQYNKPPYLMCYRIVSFDVRDSIAVTYDDHKLLFS